MKKRKTKTAISAVKTSMKNMASMLAIVRRNALSIGDMSITAELMLLLIPFTYVSLS